MSINIKISSSNDVIRLTEQSVLKCEYFIDGIDKNLYLEESIDTIRLEGKIDLKDSNSETDNVMKLGKWAGLSTKEKDCYREIEIKMYNSVGQKVQSISFEKTFIIEYQDHFNYKKGFAEFYVILRHFKDSINS